MSNNFKSIRDGYGEGLLVEASKNSKIVALTADLAESTRVLPIAQKLPQQFIECGVSEQNMMGVAAGLALAGKIPFVNSFAVFSPGRNWDQLRVSICYSNLSVKIAGHHVGLSASFDGATHMGLEDLALTRVLPNLAIIQPSDFNEAKNCVTVAANYAGPVYVRISKSTVANLSPSKQEFVVGQGQVLKSGQDLTLISSGALVGACLEVAKGLSNPDIELLKLSTVKPLDEDLILKSAAKTGQVLVVEDHQIDGGLGSAVAELLSAKLPTKVYRHGIYNQFLESGSEFDLLAKYGLDKTGILAKIKEVYKK